VSALTAAPVVVDDETLDERHLTTAVGAELKAWKHWLDVGGKSPRTLYQYERDMATLALMFPDRTLRQFNDTQILAWLKTIPAPSRGARLGGVSSFFRWAKLTRRIRENPLDWVPSVKKKKRSHRGTFTNAEVDDLLALPQQDAVLMAIMFGAGLRQSECINLQVRRLRVAEQPARIVVIGGKGDKDRVVYPFPEMAEIIREFLLMNRLEPTDYLWYARPGGRSKITRIAPISSTSFGAWWGRCLGKARVRDDAGLREANPHLARHTFATEWLRRGGRLEVLSDQLGHESIATTKDLYVHLDTRDVLIDLAAIAENSPLGRSAQ